MTSSDDIILAANDVRKTYRLGRVDVPVLRGASLQVQVGEWVAVLGASGSGKSTLLHLLGDLDQPDDVSRAGGIARFVAQRRLARRRCPTCSYPVGQSERCSECGFRFGEVFFRGQPLGSMSNRARNHYRNQSIGFVFQFYHLLPELNVLENTLLPGLVGLSRLRYYRIREELRQRAAELLQSFGLGHRLKHRPRELSGGERQRVAIARALTNRPQVLLADEPTGNLDEATGGEILDLIAAQHREGLTIVMVTHDSTIAARADRVVHLHDGRVATGETPKRRPVDAPRTSKSVTPRA